MLELRSCCEHCATPLPADSIEAMICSFECTFCSTCVADVLQNVCPNCGGGFCPRPVRPAVDRNNGNYLANYPGATGCVHKPVEVLKHQQFAEHLKTIAPHRR